MIRDPSSKRILGRLAARCLTDAELNEVSGGDHMQENPDYTSYCQYRVGGKVIMRFSDDVE